MENKSNYVRRGTASAYSAEKIIQKFIQGLPRFKIEDWGNKKGSVYMLGQSLQLKSVGILMFLSA